MQVYRPLVHMGYRSGGPPVRIPIDRVGKVGDFANKIGVTLPRVPQRPALGIGDLGGKTPIQRHGPFRAHFRPPTLIMAWGA